MFFAEIGEQELIQKGIKRFSVMNQATPSSYRPNSPLAITSFMISEVPA